MNTQKLLNSLQKYIFGYLVVQLVITLLSMPILACWGLPLSCASIIGNMIFNPFIFLFLLGSSLIFFLELFGIPNFYVIQALEFLAYAWRFVLRKITGKWLFGLGNPHWLFWLLIVVITLAILHHKKIDTLEKKTLGLSCLLSLTLLFLYYLRPTFAVEYIPCNNGNVIFIRTGNQTLLIDPGYVGQKFSTDSWIEYTLVPHLAKSYGINHIDHAIFLKPNQLLYANLPAFLQNMSIGSLYIPRLYGEKSKSFYRHFYHCKRLIEEKKITWHMLHPYHYHTINTARVYITLKPTNEKINYKTGWFYAIQGIIKHNSEEILIKPHVKSGKETITKKEEVLMDTSFLKNKKVILVVASNGYQPIEYSTPKKLLEKAGIKVFTASDKKGGAVAKDGSTTSVDLTLEDIDMHKYDGIFFIGGPGALECLDNPHSYHLISQAKKLNKAYGAICIATRILAKCYGLEGKRATGWNDDNVLETLYKGYGATYEQKDIITDDLVVTAPGPKSADLFGQGIIRVLTKEVLRNE